MPVVVACAALWIVVDPEVAELGGTMARCEIFDGCFVHLEFGGGEHFVSNGLADGKEMGSGGVGPCVECLSPDVDFMLS